MADTKITFTIPEAKIQRVIDAMKGLYPIPQIEDPENPDKMINEFTDSKWAKEAIRRQVISIVKRYEQKEAQKLAEVMPDNKIIS